MSYASTKTFRQVLAEAVAELSQMRTASPQAIEAWTVRLRNAAERELGTDFQIDRDSRVRLGAVYDRFMASAKIKKVVPGVTRFGLSIVQPKLRAELDRRIWAAADTIKRNKGAAVDRTLSRLSGWASSIPPGGSSDEALREVRSSVGKPVAQSSFERRRVDIDQTHKLLANVSDLVAVGAGAIAAEWHSHGEHDKSYDYRKEHLARAKRIYLIRGSWADEQGLIKSAHGYTDDVTMPAQEPFCRCYYRYVTSPRRLPPEMLTEKGRAWVERGAVELAKLTGAAA